MTRLKLVGNEQYSKGKLKKALESYKEAQKVSELLSDTSDVDMSEVKKERARIYGNMSLIHSVSCDHEYEISELFTYSHFLFFLFLLFLLLLSEEQSVE